MKAYIFDERIFTCNSEFSVARVNTHQIYLFLEMILCTYIYKDIVFLFVCIYIFPCLLNYSINSINNINIFRLYQLLWYSVDNIMIWASFKIHCLKYYVICLSSRTSRASAYFKYLQTLLSISHNLLNSHLETAVKFEMQYYIVQSRTLITTYVHTIKQHTTVIIRNSVFIM